MPHRGAEAAYWASFTANVAKVALFGRVNVNFVTDLQKNSRVFADISKQFIERGASLTIKTFYETDRLYGQLVCKCFAWLACRVPAEFKLPIDCGQRFCLSWSSK